MNTKELFQTIEQHFNQYTKPVDSHGNESYITTSFTYRVNEFNISAYTIPVSGKNNYLQYQLLSKRVNASQGYKSLKEKEFFKLIKQKQKDSYLYYVITDSKESPKMTFKLPTFLFLDDALTYNNPKSVCMWGLKSSGKFSCVAKVNKSGKEFWKLRKRE